MHILRFLVWLNIKLPGSSIHVNGCLAGWDFPKSIFHLKTDDFFFFFLDLSQNYINKGNEHVIVNLFLIYPEAPCVVGLARTRHKRRVNSDGRTRDGGRSLQFLSRRAFGETGPVCLSRPPWLGLASCTSSGSASRLSGHPHPSDPGQHRGGASCRLTLSHDAASLTQLAGTAVV